MEILTLDKYLKQTFGCKVYKLSLSTGATCPNRDGTFSYGGCAFCSEGGSGDFASSFDSLENQIKKAKLLVDKKFPKKISSENRKYIAYFQSFTNTYGNQEKLKSLFKKTLEFTEIAALSIATRADCLSNEMIDFLSELNKKKPVWIELGFQTVHQKTHLLLNTKFSLEVFEKIYAKLKEKGICVIAHVILGLPGESEAEMKQSVKYLASLTPVLDGIKLQLLHILEGTELAQMYREKPFKIFSLEEYCRLVVDCLKLLPPQTVIHRMTGDGPKKILVEPKWSADKKRVLNTLNKMIREEN